jgi:two-component system KDP operon response regulator KdpE
VNNDATVVLVVEDDRNIVDLVRANLMVRGFSVLVSRTGEDVIELLRTSQADIVLLDLMLPGADGFDLCRDIRAVSSVGLIVVSARRGEQDKVRALNLGADDYLTKPFGVEELLARITALLRRSRPANGRGGGQGAARQGAGGQGAGHGGGPGGGPGMSGGGGGLDATVPLHFGNITVDLDAQAVFKGGEAVHLTPTEFALLRELVQAPGKLLSHATLLRKVWGPGYETETEYTRVYVRRLRAKLEDPDGAPFIATEPRAGYRLVAPPTGPPS